MESTVESTVNSAANTPILVGAAAVEQRLEDPALAREACELMLDAVREAARQAGADALLTRAQRIYVPRGMYLYHTMSYDYLNTALFLLLVLLLLLLRRMLDVPSML